MRKAILAVICVLSIKVASAENSYEISPFAYVQGGWTNIDKTNTTPFRSEAAIGADVSLLGAIKTSIKVSQINTWQSGFSSDQHKLDILSAYVKIPLSETVTATAGKTLRNWDPGTTIQPLGMFQARSSVTDPFDRYRVIEGVPIFALEKIDKASSYSFVAGYVPTSFTVGDKATIISGRFGYEVDIGSFGFVATHATDVPGMALGYSYTTEFYDRSAIFFMSGLVNPNGAQKKFGIGGSLATTSGFDFGFEFARDLSSKIGIDGKTGSALSTRQFLMRVTSNADLNRIFGTSVETSDQSLYTASIFLQSKIRSKLWIDATVVRRKFAMPTNRASNDLHSNSVVIGLRIEL
jgi:hypothetical protein